MMPAADYLVINENTLGYRLSGDTNVGVLAGNVWKGGHDPIDGVITLDAVDRVRRAGRADFQAFRVSPKGHLPEAD